MSIPCNFLTFIAILFHHGHHQPTLPSRIHLTTIDGHRVCLLTLQTDRWCQCRFWGSWDLRKVSHITMILLMQSSTVLPSWHSILMFLWSSTLMKVHMSHLFFSAWPTVHHVISWGLLLTLNPEEQIFRSTGLADWQPNMRRDETLLIKVN